MHCFKQQEITVGTPYVIYKGGSQDEPFYDQVVANWQTLATATIVKK